MQPLYRAWSHPKLSVLKYTVNYTKGFHQ